MIVKPDSMRLSDICPLSCKAGDKMGPWGQIIRHGMLLSPKGQNGDKFVPVRKPDAEPFGDKTGVRGQMRDKMRASEASVHRPRGQISYFVPILLYY